MVKRRLGLYDTSNINMKKKPKSKERRQYNEMDLTLYSEVPRRASLVILDIWREHSWFFPSLSRIILVVLGEIQISWVLLLSSLTCGLPLCDYPFGLFNTLTCWEVISCTALCSGYFRTCGVSLIELSWPNGGDIPTLM